MNIIINTGANVTQGVLEGSPNNSINFRDLEIGKNETRVIYLKNETDKEIFYCIIADEGGVFR
jgi:predicted transcriptional regulator